MPESVRRTHGSRRHRRSSSTNASTYLDGLSSIALGVYRPRSGSRLELSEQLNHFRRLTVASDGHARKGDIDKTDVHSALRVFHVRLEIRRRRVEPFDRFAEHDALRFRRTLSMQLNILLRGSKSNCEQDAHEMSAVYVRPYI